MSEYVVKLKSGLFYGGEDAIVVLEHEAIRMTRDLARHVATVTGGEIQRV